MESVGAFPEGEWDCFSRIFFTEEAADFAVQYPFSGENDLEGLSFDTSSIFWPTHEADESLFYSSDTINSNLCQFSQESSYSTSRSSSVSFPAPSQENYYLSDFNHIPMANNTYESMNFCMMDEKNSGSSMPIFSDKVVEMVVNLNEEGGFIDGGHPEAVNAIIPAKELQLKRKSEMHQLPAGANKKTDTEMSQNPKKKSRVSRDVQKMKKNVESKKNQKLSTPNGNDEEENNAGPNGQSSSCYSSEDDSNASQELNGGTISESKGSASLNLKGKTRASRGSATDPQSLYARKRRERINERLRILQNLVPNGTKVDISTMLEEAVQYVQFLQLQIKLLSSDDMWMYAPIAYNGMDIGLIRKSSPPL